jgi:hypothetical protein
LASGDKILSVASLSDDAVLVSTRRGRVFSVVPFLNAQELTVDAGESGRIHNLVIVSESDAIAFALFSGVNAGHSAVGRRRLGSARQQRQRRKGPGARDKR